MPNYVYNVSNLQINNNVYRNTIVNSVNLKNTPWTDNSMVNAFYNCVNLTEVTNINSNVNTMYSAFNGCTNLVNAPAIPNSVEILEFAFYNCSSLTSITIPNSVTNMKSTFAGCTNLPQIPTIPNSVTDLSSTFRNCTSITNVNNIPNSVINMGYTFYNCTNLTDIISLPNSITQLSYTFYNCSSLVNIPTIPDSIINLESTFSNCTNLINAPVIGNSVSYMNSTFAGCTNLNSTVNIPNSVTSLYRCFADCTSFTNDVYISSFNIANASQLFVNTSNNKNIHIPYYVLYTNQIACATKSTFDDEGYNENGSKEGVYVKNLTPTFHIEVTPNTSLVQFEVDGHNVQASSISVKKNDVVNWTASKAGYATQSGTKTITQDETLNVTLIENTFTLTIIPIPVTATVILTATGYPTVSGTGTQSIAVRSNTVVDYEVSAQDYVTVTDSITILADETDTIELEPESQEYAFNLDTDDLAIITDYTGPRTDITVPLFVNGDYSSIFRVNPTPADATVTLVASGYTQENNEIAVLPGTNVTYTVSKPDYITATDTVTVTTPQDLNVTLTYHAVNVENFNYSSDANHNVTLTEYTGNETDVIVPTIEEIE